MGRVVVGANKETPAERRRREAREAAAAAAAESGPARRGEEDEQAGDSPDPAAVVAAPAETAFPAQQTQTAALVAVSAAPAAVNLPDPGAAPADQLAVCEQHIHRAKARWTAKVQDATGEFVAEAGPYLAWVHENKLYKLMKGNDGKPFRSFAKYLKEQHDLPRRTGYRITQTIPLLKVLEEAGHSLPDLSARQVDALHPVRTQHGAGAVARVWAAAWSTKKGPLPTPEELEKAKQLLGLTTRADPDEEAPELTAAAVDPGAAVERAVKLLVPETVREAVRKDPDRVRLLHHVLGEALAEAGVPLE
jgi:hypothetical protein